MKLVQTFWTPKEKSVNSLKMGWLHTKYHLLSWILSACSIRQLYQNLELITDNFGREILINQLQLPYTNVRTDFENKAWGYPEDIWVCNKLWSYTIHNEPFLNIDGDVFIWKPFSENIINADLIAQNIEQNLDFYKISIFEIQECFGLQPNIYFNENSNNISAVNAGILGGNNFLFFKEFVKDAFDFIENNKSKLHQISTFYLNTTIEQFFFFQLASQKNIKISYISDEITTPDYLPHFTNFAGVPHFSNYIHIMGGKKYETICEQLEYKVMEEFPIHYQRLNKLLNILPKSIYFSSKNKDLIESYFERTISILKAIDVDRNLNFHSNLNAMKKEINLIIQKIDNEKSYMIANEIFQFETTKYEFVENLPIKNALIEYKVNIIRQWGAVFKNNLREIPNFKLKIGKYACFIDTEWNWAEKKEFKNQVESPLTYLDNLKLPPHFFRTIFFVYAKQGIIREYLMSPLEIILLDCFNNETPTPNIESITTQVKENLFLFGIPINDNICDIILDKISNLVYQGVLEPIQDIQ